MKAKITRRTIVGYAVNTTPTQDNPGYHFETPTAPMWEGTLKTIGEKLAADRYLNSLTSTFYSSAWFVKVNGTWFRVVNQDDFNMETDNLLAKRDDYWSDKKYLSDAVEVEVDYPTERARAAAEMGRKPKGDVSRNNGKNHRRKQ